MSKSNSNSVSPALLKPAWVLPYKTENIREVYTLGRKLGQGQFGTTFLCTQNATGRTYACKSIPKRKLLCKEDYDDVWREIQIMHHLSEHPNVVRIHGTYEDASSVHLVMELCEGGELFDRLSYIWFTWQSTLATTMGEVDPAFIQDQHHRPKFSTIQAEDIPVIDLSPVTNHTASDPSSLEGLVKEIGSACKKWGFFQVTNHGVPLTLRQNIEKASRLFFAQNLEEKRKVSKDENNSTGYHDTEHTKNIRDWKEVFDFLARDPTFIPLTSDEHDDRVTQLTNQSPQYPPNFRVILQEYIQEMEKLCFKVLELIALSLGVEAKRFEEFFMKDQTSSIRLNHYPPCPYPHLALGVGRHKDPGALTILAQDEVGGLEVKLKGDQEWIRVKPIPDAYIINVGDIIQVWSNDAYESVEHRVVVNSEKERFSIPFFFYPSHETEVKPLEELLNEQNPSKYRPYKWGKFITHRKNTNFKKQNVENLQIYHYKLA